MSKKKRNRKYAPPPGGETSGGIETVYPVYPPGTPPPKTILGAGPDGTYVVIWRATEAEPTPPPSLWPPMPPGPTR